VQRFRGGLVFKAQTLGDADLKIHAGGEEALQQLLHPLHLAGQRAVVERHVRRELRPLGPREVRGRVRNDPPAGHAEPRRPAGTEEGGGGEELFACEERATGPMRPGGGAAQVRDWRRSPHPSDRAPQC